MAYETAVGIIYLGLLAVLSFFGIVISDRQQILGVRDQMLNVLKVLYFLMLPWFMLVGLQLATTIAIGDAAAANVVSLLNATLKWLMWFNILTLVIFGLVGFRLVFEYFQGATRIDQRVEGRTSTRRFKQ